MYFTQFCAIDGYKNSESCCHSNVCGKLFIVAMTTEVRLVCYNMVTVSMLLYNLLFSIRLFRSFVLCHAIFHKVPMHQVGMRKVSHLYIHVSLRITVCFCCPCLKHSCMVLRYPGMS